MTTYGVTPEGFVAKPLLVIKEEMENSLRVAFGQSINLSAKSVFGQFVGIMSEREALLWELAEAVYRSRDPDSATDASLDIVCALTGTLRKGEFKSSTILTCTGTPLTLLALGRVVSVTSTGVKFVTAGLSSSTIAAVSPWTSITSYFAGNRVTNTNRVYQCISGGISGVSAPSGTASVINDGSVQWTYVGEGTGAVDVFAESQFAGPYVALARTLTSIDTPVGGWQTATNLLDAVEGASTEADALLRLRREAELQGPGKSTVAAIREAVSLVGVDTSNPVTSCVVFENDTSATNVDGMPPKSIEVLAEGGVDEEIRAKVFEYKAAGIQAYGTNSGSVVDDEGVSHTVAFSRPTLKNVYVTVNVSKDPTTFPPTGDVMIKSAIVAFGDAQKIGKDAVASSIGAQCFKVAGVLDVTATLIGLFPAPGSSTTIVCNNRERAAFDTVRVVVNLSNGSP